ncbi:hypothetical protein [Geomonas propionica]|uniref:Chromosome partitioning protein ParB n=1 Tax=Geomonas propionica TaxID=2798582 RepID=A0ABS0YQI2_9BACT|nr:hypothetical protein [Geomonas propionica]MBJ6799745.1 hypothetical protein [Geomonas propionica]
MAGFRLTSKKRRNEMAPSTPTYSDAQPSQEEEAPAPEGRSRLSCDISVFHHRLLKVYAAQNGMSILDVVERLIEQNCKEGV